MYVFLGIICKTGGLIYWLGTYICITYIYMCWTRAQSVSLQTSLTYSRFFLLDGGVFFFKKKPPYSVYFYKTIIYVYRQPRTNISYQKLWDRGRQRQHGGGGGGINIPIWRGQTPPYFSFFLLSLSIFFILFFLVCFADFFICFCERALHPFVSYSQSTHPSLLRRAPAPPPFTV